MQEGREGESRDKKLRQCAWVNEREKIVIVRTSEKMCVCVRERERERERRSKMRREMCVRA
jgi:hypothetical protein